MKRSIDFVLAAVGLVVLLPLGLLAALGIKLTSRGPIFFRQERMGLNGRKFRIFKFRTMAVQAPGTGCLVTAGGDSRITPLGAFLRRHKIDELPQLINVLLGEMSLMGPRPEVAEFAELFPRQYARILQVRPGITHPVTLCFRAEELILARVADPRRFYIDTIMPEKLSAYEAQLKLSLVEDIRTIVATVLPELRPRWAPSAYGVDHFAVPSVPLAEIWALDTPTAVANIPAFAAEIESQEEVELARVATSGS